MYKKVQAKVVVFLILLVDDILLISNGCGNIIHYQEVVGNTFWNKDLGEASYILGIQLLRDRKNKVLALSQAMYIEKILKRFSLENSKKGLWSFRHGIPFSNKRRTWERFHIQKQLEVSCIPCVMHQTRYLLHYWHGQQISIQSWTSTLDYYQVYSEIFEKNKRLYACVFQCWSNSRRLN